MRLKVFKFIFNWLIIFILGLVSFLLLDHFYPIADVSHFKKFSHLVVDRNGEPLRAFADEQGVWRYPTKFDKVSKNYIEALINYEDRSYWDHHGVNPFALVRAFYQFVVNQRAISGGSTLTMQVARILEPHKKTISGKLWQMFRAYQLEYHLDKKQILEIYLNYAPFGGPIEGIEAATFTYLGKSAAELTDSEAALMAVLPQSPSRYRPDRYPEKAQRARDKVLNRLDSFNLWSSERITLAKQEVVVAEFNSKPLIAPLLSRRLVGQFPEKQLIKSTIDLNIQLQVADQVKHYLSRFSESTSASAIVVNNSTLEVIAYVGAGDFANQKRFGHIDMNRAIRSPGSTLKPFIYGIALDEKIIHAQSLLQDVPQNFSGYSPKNFTRNFSGPVSVTQALQRSLNVPAVQVLEKLGAKKFAGQMQNAGLKMYFPSHSAPSLSLALGGVGVKLEDLLSVYRSLAAGGYAGKLRYTEDSVKTERFLMSKESAWIIGDMLSKVSLSGNQTALYYKGLLQTSNQWVAHKTGTSYGYRDAWMIAVTDEYSLAVWIGKPDGTPSPGEFGRKTAAPLVKKILNALASTQNKQPKRPPDVALKSICWPLGTLKNRQNNIECLQQKSAWLINNIAPPTLNDATRFSNISMKVDIDPVTKQRVFSSCFSGKMERHSIAVWPARLEPWLTKKWQYSQLVPATSKNCLGKIDVVEKLIIIGVQNNSRIMPAPDNRNAFSISLQVSIGVGTISWLKNGEFIGETKVGESINLSDFERGKQVITVFDQNGNSGEIDFVVI